MDDLIMRTMREELIIVINKHDSIPIEARRLIVKEVYDIVKNASEEQIRREREELAQQQKSEEASKDGVSEDL